MIIRGNSHVDQRGSLSFFNDFDMSQIRRFYSIQPDVGLIRAWQGHKLESKWFHVIKGSFRVKLRALETKELVGEFKLNAQCPEVLCIPKGVYNGFEALEESSVLMVFSDASLEQSVKDDYRTDTTDLPW
ncbi:MAG: dTDP-4-dehydrorhamnose 3,5-epimerase-like enzyme [Sediminicola sp.]|jgi:dTDP-4-dehydrorhamnose 3,5-epimerase